MLGLVADMDSDTGKIGDFPFEPSFEIETSPGNFQPAIIFDRPATPDEAEPLAKALQRATGADFGTGDIAHVWRVPGTLNWPTAKKIARGRSPHSVPVCLSRPWRTVKVPINDAQRTLSQRAMDEDPVASQSTTEDESDDPDVILAKLPLKTRDDICRAATPHEDRSRRCMRAVLSMIEAGLSDTGIHTVTEAYPDGPFGRYHVEGKALDAEIERAFVGSHRRGARQSQTSAIPGKPVDRTTRGPRLLLSPTTSNELSTRRRAPSSTLVAASTSTPIALFLSSSITRLRLMANAFVVPAYSSGASKRYWRTSPAPHISRNSRRVRMTR